MKSQMHQVDLRYTKEELLTIVAVATREDVDLGGYYHCHGGAIHLWSHPWNHAAVRYDSSRLGALYVAVYLPTADKYRRLTRRPPQGQKGLDERARMAFPWPFHPW